MRNVQNLSNTFVCSVAPPSLRRPETATFSENGPGVLCGRDGGRLSEALECFAFNGLTCLAVLL